MRKLRTKLIFAYGIIALCAILIGVISFPTFFRPDFFYGGKEKMMNAADRLCNFIQNKEASDHDVNGSQLTEFIYDAMQFDPYTEVLLFDQDGKVLCATYAWNKNTFFKQEFLDETNFFNRTLGGEEIQEIEFQDTTYFIYTRPFQSDALPQLSYLGFAKTAAFYYNSIGGIIRIMAFMLGFIALISIMIGIFMSRSIVAIIRDLERYAVAIGDGRQVEFVPSTFATEINSLGKNMQKMDLQLRSMQQRQKNYFGRASHEIKTPLMIIQGYSEGIANGVVKDTQKALASITAECKRVNTIVEQLLLLSKIEDSVLAYHLVPVNLYEFLGNLLDSLHCLSKNIMYRDDASQPEIWVQADEELLHQAVINPISNALHYSKEQVTVSINKEGKYGVIRVEDDGGGMRAEDLPFIFDRFYSRTKGHTGLGMAIVKSAIEQMNGYVTAENKGLGLAITIFIPLVE